MKPRYHFSVVVDVGNLNHSKDNDHLYRRIWATIGPAKLCVLCRNSVETSCLGMNYGGRRGQGQL